MNYEEPQHASPSDASLPEPSGSPVRSCGSSSLDADTPRGRDAIRWARKGSEAFLRAYPSLRLAETDQGEPADVDGILYSIMKGCVIKGVVEIKTRYMSLDKLMGPYKGEWLITKNKLDRGIQLALGLRCPFVGLLVLPNSGVCLSKQIADKDGNWTCSFREETTKTSASVNGGEMTGLNAFIDMTDAKQFKIQ